MDRRVLQNAVRNVLDGELLNRYLYLSTMERGELAKKIGTTPDIVSARLRAPASPRATTRLLCPHPTLSSRSWTTCWRLTASLLTSSPWTAPSSFVQNTEKYLV